VAGSFEVVRTSGFVKGGELLEKEINCDRAIAQAVRLG